MLKSATPIFRMFDEDKAREFYIDYLGFQIEFEHRFHDDAPLYVGLTRDNVKLHLSEHHGDATPGSTVRIDVGEIETFHKSLPDYKYAKPGILDQTWGCMEIRINDPFDNTLVFFEDK